MAKKINYASELNPQQLAAVNHVKGPALIIAGAGTGKTRTLIFRVAKLVEDGVDPSKILLLTFTRRASGEMLKRAGECQLVDIEGNVRPLQVQGALPALQPGETPMRFECDSGLGNEVRLSMTRR